MKLNRLPKAFLIASSTLVLIIGFQNCSNSLNSDMARSLAHVQNQAQRSILKQAEVRTEAKQEQSGSFKIQPCTKITAPGSNIFCSKYFYLKGNVIDEFPSRSCAKHIESYVSTGSTEMACAKLDFYLDDIKIAQNIQPSSYNYSMSIPANTVPGIYNLYATIKRKDGVELKSETIKIEVINSSTENLKDHPNVSKFFLSCMSNDSSLKAEDRNKVTEGTTVSCFISNIITNNGIQIDRRYEKSLILDFYANGEKIATDITPKDEALNNQYFFTVPMGAPLGSYELSAVIKNKDGTLAKSVYSQKIQVVSADSLKASSAVSETPTVTAGSSSSSIKLPVVASTATNPALSTNGSSSVAISNSTSNAASSNSGRRCAIVGIDQSIAVGEQYTYLFDEVIRDGKLSCTKATVKCEDNGFSRRTTACLASDNPVPYCRIIEANGINAPKVVTMRLNETLRYSTMSLGYLTMAQKNKVYNGNTNQLIAENNNDLIVDWGGVYLKKEEPIKDLEHYFKLHPSMTELKVVFDIIGKSAKTGKWESCGQQLTLIVKK